MSRLPEFGGICQAQETLPYIGLSLDRSFVNSHAVRQQVKIQARYDSGLG
jgi:hypothetical protein